MDRKTLISLIVILAIMIVGTGVAVAFLYSDNDRSNNEIKQVADDDRCLLLSAVPSDAVAVCCFKTAAEACGSMLSAYEFPRKISACFADDSLSAFAKSRMAVSLHYSGRLQPLYIFEVSGKTATAQLSDLKQFVSDRGMALEQSDGLALISESEALVKSALRHIEKSVSVINAPGFADALATVPGQDVILLSNAYSDKLMSATFEKEYRKYSGFFMRVAEWLAFDVSQTKDRFSLKGTAIYDSDVSDFMNVLAKSEPAVSCVSEVLPSYTLFAVSIPMKDPVPYMDAYDAYADSRQVLQGMQARRKELAGKTGIKPEVFMEKLQVREVAVAHFRNRSKVEKVCLMKVADCDVGILFKGTDVTSLRNYVPKVHSFPYSSFISSVFGDLFALEDESCFTYFNGWVISGSLSAVQEYVNGNASGYTLKEFMTDAGQSELLAAAPSSVVAYCSFSEEGGYPKTVLKPDFMKYIAPFYEDCAYAPAVLSVHEGKKSNILSFDLLKLELQKPKVSMFKRDTVVVIPKAEFKVMNSGTGQMNTFYQNASNAVCLKDENGKDLWGIPFKTKLCGTAYNIDYYANGKLQIIFGSGSKIYIIDRLSRFVSGFPIDLGKEILLGPDLYDFSGAHKYNILVLHKDNMVEMYNLKGQKPASWKGITSKETIKALPERLMVGGKTFWTVRTSIQTLVFPFYGGEPLTVFEGDRMIRPDSEIKAVDASTIEFVCYDGKRRTLKVK